MKSLAGPSSAVEFPPRADLRRGWHTFVRVFRVVVLLGLFAASVPGIRPDESGVDYRALGYARGHLFDFVEWEAGALADKAVMAAVGPGRYMTEDERVAAVRQYLAVVGRIDDLEGQIRALYVDPDVADPAAASADLRAERDTLREWQRGRQALAEGIIQAQVAEELADLGFGTGGEVLPPVAIRFTELPTMLILSPRDHIERVGAYPLEHGITVDGMERLENRVDTEMDMSSLVTPIGGLAVWPAMLVETGSLPTVYEVAAHEWTHHYLAFFPLGFNYGVTPDLVTINETVANIVGGEVGYTVLARYYPDLAGEPPDYAPIPPEPAPAEGEEAPVFDFRAEMHATRVRADALLAAGRIDEAERYMEARRRLFVENGYAIRKLNQAYFAFYGSYADEPGAAGADPIGPALRELRYRSASLADFVSAVRGITTRDEVMEALETARTDSAVGR
jgi:hypothetical protein